MTTTNASQIGNTYDCKIAGCTKPAKANRGPFAYLCDEHKNEKPTNGKVDGYAAQIKELTRLGKVADKKKATAAKAKTAAETAASEADDAAMDFKAVAQRMFGSER